MNPPAGTYLAKTEDDRIHVPPAISAFIQDSQWNTLLVVSSPADESLTIYPVPYPAVDPTSGFTTKLAMDGTIAIGEANQRAVKLKGQGVMIRVEGDVVRVYLRRVFQTLGFRPD